MAEDGAIATIPDSLSYQDAVALCFGGMTALYFFRRGKLAADETVLINGASGAVGTMAVQLAKHLGAEVTAVCSGANVRTGEGSRGRPRHRLHNAGFHDATGCAMT